MSGGDQEMDPFGAGRRGVFGLEGPAEESETPMVPPPGRRLSAMEVAAAQEEIARERSASIASALDAVDPEMQQRRSSRRGSAFALSGHKDSSSPLKRGASESKDNNSIQRGTSGTVDPKRCTSVASFGQSVASDDTDTNLMRRRSSYMKEFAQSRKKSFSRTLEDEAHEASTFAQEQEGLARARGVSFHRAMIVADQRPENRAQSVMEQSQLGYKRMSILHRKASVVNKREQEFDKLVENELAMIPDIENFSGMPADPKRYQDSRGYGFIIEETLQQRREKYELGKLLAKLLMFLILIGIFALVLVLQAKSVLKRSDPTPQGLDNSTVMQMQTDGAVLFFSEEQFREAVSLEAGINRERIIVHDVFSTTLLPYPGYFTPTPAQATARGAGTLSNATDASDIDDEFWTSGAYNYDPFDPSGGIDAGEMVPWAKGAESSGKEARRWRRAAGILQTEGDNAGAASVATGRDATAREMLVVHFQIVNMDITLLSRAVARLRVAVVRDFNARKQGIRVVADSRFHTFGIYTVSELILVIATRPPSIKFGTTDVPITVTEQPTPTPILTPAPTPPPPSIRNLRCGSRREDLSRDCEPGLVLDPTTLRCRCDWSRASRTVCLDFQCVFPPWDCTEPLSDQMDAVSGNCGLSLDDCKAECESTAFCVGILHDRRRPGNDSCYLQMRDGLGFPPDMSQQLNYSTSCVLDARYIPKTIRAAKIAHTSFGVMSAESNVTISAAPLRGTLVLTPVAMGVTFEPRALTFARGARKLSQQIRYIPDGVEYSPDASFFTPLPELLPGETPYPPTPEPSYIQGGVRKNLTHIYRASIATEEPEAGYRVDIDWVVSGGAANEYEPVVGGQQLGISESGRTWLEPDTEQQEALRFGRQGVLGLTLNQPFPAGVPVAISAWPAEEPEPTRMDLPHPQTPAPPTPAPVIRRDLNMRTQDGVVERATTGLIDDGYERAYPEDVAHNVTVAGVQCTAFFKQIDIEDSENCTADAVEVFTRATPGVSLGRYCGSRTPTPIVGIEGDGFVVVFTTNGANAENLDHSGFVLEYQCDRLELPTPAPPVYTGPPRFIGLTDPNVTQSVIPQQRGVVVSPRWQWLARGETHVDFYLYGVETGTFSVRVYVRGDLDAPAVVNVTVAKPTTADQKYNVAHLTGLARQSSTPDSCVAPQCAASAAVDSLATIADPVAITAYPSDPSAPADTKPWWEVVLDTPYAVTSLVLRNRVDCCTDRFFNITTMLMLGDSVVYRSDVANPRAWVSRADGGAGGALPYDPTGLLAGSQNTSAPATVTHEFTPLVITDRVRIIKDNGENTAHSMLSTLNLLEVEAWSIQDPTDGASAGGVGPTPSPSIYQVPDDATLYNIAWAASLSQSSVKGGCTHCGPATTVDHVVCANSGHSMTETDSAKADRTPWVAFQFRQTMPIHSVKLFNRHDCCRERLRDIQIEGIANGEPVASSAKLNPGNALNGPESITWTLATPRYLDKLNISKTNDGDVVSIDIALSFAEIEIYSYEKFPTV